MVFSKILSQQTKIFNVSNKITSISSIDAFIVISRDIFHALDLKNEIMEYLFVKFQVFAVNWTENYYKRNTPCITLKIGM